MAVSPAAAPSVLEAAKPVEGSLRLIALRWVLWIVSALPGVAATSGALEEAIGRRPYFADAPDPLPLDRLARLMSDMPGSIWGPLTVGLSVAWLVHLLLTAGAVEILSRTPGRTAHVWRSVAGAGTKSIWAYLRIALLAVVLIAIGNKLAGAVFDRLDEYGQLAGWTGKTLAFTLPLTRGLLFFLWAGTVGVLAWWCRVIVVAQPCRRVRRLPLKVLRLWLRHPFQGLVFHLALGLATVFASAALLYGWRQSEASAAGWSTLWLAMLLLQAFVWHWRLRASCRLWAAHRR